MYNELSIAIKLGSSIGEGDMDVWDQANDLMDALVKRFKLAEDGRGTGFGARDGNFVLPKGLNSANLISAATAMAKKAGLEIDYCNVNEYDEDDDA